MILRVVSDRKRPAGSKPRGGACTGAAPRGLLPSYMTQERGIGKAETVLCFYRFGKAWTIAADRGGKKHPAFSLRCRRQNRFCGTAAQALRTQARFSAPPLLGWVYKHFSPLQSQKCETSSTFEIGAFFKSAVLQAGGRGLFTQNTRSFSDSAHPPRRFAGDTVLSIPPRAAGRLYAAAIRFSCGQRR